MEIINSIIDNINYSNIKTFTNVNNSLNHLPEEKLQFTCINIIPLNLIWYDKLLLKCTHLYIHDTRVPNYTMLNNDIIKNIDNIINILNKNIQQFSLQLLKFRNRENIVGGTYMLSYNNIKCAFYIRQEYNNYFLLVKIY